MRVTMVQSQCSCHLLCLEQLWSKPLMPNGLWRDITDSGTVKQKKEFRHKLMVVLVVVLNKAKIEERKKLLYWQLGAGIAQWLERWTRDWKVTGSNPCWSGGRIFFSRVSFLCWLLFWYPFHPCVTAVAHKRPQSFCQKCRWQVTAKHACTLCMWFCMKWHGAWLYGVHRICTEMAAISCGTSHASSVSTPLQWIFKKVL